MPKFSGPPIQTKNGKGSIFVMLAITTAQMRRFGVEDELRKKLQEDVKGCHSFKEACDLIREWFPLDTDFIVLNNCPHTNCQYPGCPKICEGRKHIKTKLRQVEGENGIANR